MTACVQMVSTPYSGCNYDHFDFIRTTVTQAEQLCYDVCSFRPENIRGLFIDSPNTTAADLVGFFPLHKSLPTHLSAILPAWVNAVTGGEARYRRKEENSFQVVRACLTLAMSHTHTHCRFKHSPSTVASSLMAKGQR